MTGMTGGLTAEDVRSTELSKPPLGKRGYDKKSVDDFLALVARRLDGRGHLGADDVRNIVFPRPPLFQRGYDEDDVDNLLDAVVATLEQ
ncbi:MULTISPECIES: DivIVA domain-containing protein [unclassified Mycolicibacterium]|uniref:DivIVA domain-containing protein n=1 Tax=unclassified Mycolicibacterium TaxID=2636767 RepID=UPI0012DF1248|nr:MULTISPECIES: DivIVA domain-containing protein [unclassified Mycolicibacterium]MUL82869.1 DivIVA domain-containing protein [Mycolicibacterium sp. CBMA 329]MUL89204.1 DivIVA domain-containing protein [Mycolicibacterium sp. CBMA 331]MUL97771.1 DivIVA domain-containing protein [Mycolicibacterium sp. CBMA 334]MUM25116.1 DivIVA domain-containing protein [Mycolicibacterium sp. CBMA 295]MUM38720.1 DivIVA domain-containing protein [Mycolicibacterium sp. CBMA 247]